MRTRILFGTESGNSEMIAEDVASALAPVTETVVDDLQSVEPDDLAPDDLHLIVCSTYGEGELPASAQPFMESLAARRPSLEGVRYAVFGLGDSGYADSYSKGSEQLAALLNELGATRIGEFGRHDAASFDDASELAIAWGWATVSLLIPA